MNQRTLDTIVEMKHVLDNIQEEVQEDAQLGTDSQFYKTIGNAWAELEDATLILSASLKEKVR